ncbi:MAG: apolipoprotein N-acyltransferase [Deltaproteobacteria bacterium]|nr:apolipoprotein N-acyltransferase [Deltaproteobacteria bacterium]
MGSKDRRVTTGRDLLCAVLSGLMLTASFPPGRLEWMVWIALLPLLRAIRDRSPAESFRLGLAAGLSHYLTLLYWVLVVLDHYGGIHPVLSLGILGLFSFYLALYPALFSALTARIGRRSPMIFTWAALWAGLEYVRAHALTGFPWCLLAHTQYRNPMLIQIADLLGAYGVTFLIVLVNGLLYALLFEHLLRKRLLLIGKTAVVASIVLLFLLYGYHALSAGEARVPAPKTLRVAVIQGNIDQSVKWNPAYQEATIHKYVQMSASTMPFEPDVILWPETSVPLFFQDGSNLAGRVMEVPRRTGAFLVFGSPAYRRQKGATRYYNRVYVLSPEGTLCGTYDKVHLVPFGEYVPLKRFLPFIDRLVVAAGDFASGERIAPVTLSDMPAGILICFEVIFPELARTQVRKGARILINLTNDAWFGSTGAPYQHLAMTVFRAVENRRPLVRAANTGISALIGPRGKIHARSDLFRAEVLQGILGVEAPLISFYTQHGDVFSFSLFLFLFIRIFLVFRYNIGLSMRPAPSRSGKGGARTSGHLSN